MAKQHAPTFGGVLRERRLAKAFSLRGFAAMVGVSPTYLSLIERGAVGPPTAERVQRMAELLNEHPDELIALARRIPADLPGIIQRQPTEISALLRAVKDLSAPQLQRLRRVAERLRRKSKHSARDRIGAARRDQ